MTFRNPQPEGLTGFNPVGGGSAPFFGFFWGNYVHGNALAGYRIDGGGFLHLQGVISNNSDAPAATVVFLQVPAPFDGLEHQGLIAWQFGAGFGPVPMALVPHGDGTWDFLMQVGAGAAGGIVSIDDIGWYVGGV